MAESFSREKLRHAAQKEGGPVLPSSCVTPTGTSNQLDVQNKGKKTHTHTHTHTYLVLTVSGTDSIRD